MRLTKLYIIPAVVAACMAAAGCSMINDPETLCPEKEEEVSFRFKVNSAVNSTGHELTRSDDQNHGEVDSEVPLVEDMINVNDFAFFIFIGRGDNAPMLSAVTDIAASTDANTSISGGIGIYDVSVVVKKELIEKYLGHDLSPNLAFPVNFRLVVLANTTADRNTSGNFSSLPMTTVGSASESSPPTTLADFMAEAAKLTYEITTAFYNQEESSPWIKGVIPMFGIRSFVVPESVIYRSRPDDRIYLGEINLLRAVSKVRVVDAIQKSEEGYPRISDVTITYASSRGLLLPENAMSYDDGHQVHQVNIPEQTHAHNFTVSFLDHHAQNPGNTGDTSTQWLVYVPEQIITKGSVPIVTITVQPATDANTQIFRIPMSGYDDRNFPWTGSEGFLLRNHVYEFKVTWSPAGQPILQYIVCPWREYDPVDVPSFG